MKLISLWRFQSVVKDYTVKADICVKSFSSSFQPFVMYLDDRWQPGTLQRKSELCSSMMSFMFMPFLLFLILPSHHPEVIRPLKPFVLWLFHDGWIMGCSMWLNESLRRDGSNLAFLFELWHSAIEINERAKGLNTFTDSRGGKTEKQPICSALWCFCSPFLDLMACDGNMESWKSFFIWTVWIYC